MPELPEVETTCLGITPHLLQQQITKIIIRQPQLRQLIPQQLSQQLPTASFTKINRRAKYLLLFTTKGTLLIHLGMSGHLRITDSQQPINKHAHVDILLSNNKILRYTDPRRFGLIDWYPIQQDIYQHPLLIKLGVEPLSPDFHPKYLQQQFANKKCVIKQALMDSKIVVGIGNIYAAEILFHAKIHPQHTVKNLQLTQLENIITASKKILQQSITAGGTTLQDFYAVDGKPGYFSQQLKIYGREGEQCINCQHTIQKIKQTQRSTFFCPNCQTL